jgi:hypothetical protein
MGLFDALSFEVFNAKDMAKNAVKNPDQMLLGANDPFSAKVWGTITGKDYKPMVNQLGGPTEDAYQRAEAEGINTGSARTGHAIAQAIASFYSGGAAAGAMGAGGSAAGSGASMGGGQGLLAGGGSTGLTAGGGTGLAAPSGAMTPTFGASSASGSSGGLLSQSSPYLQSANNVMSAAAKAKSLAGGQQQQAPAVSMGGGQATQLGQNGLTANQRRQRGLLG